MARRVLFVTAGLSRGGAETFLARLAGRLVEHGHVCAVASLGAPSPLATDLEARGVPVTELTRGRLAAAWRLARRARAFRPDVIQGWMYRGNLAATFASRVVRPRPALVWSVRQGLNDLETSPAGTRRAVAWSARASGGPRAIVYNAVSAARAHEAVGFHAERTRIIPNGIDVPASPLPDADRERARAGLGLAPDAFAIGLFARWHPVKNHHGFVEAASAFSRAEPRARFVLAGAGVDRENAELASWLQAAGIAERCLLLGERPDAAELVAALDVATLASHGEALPNALLEAMAAGVPCVAPDVGDLAALIGDTGQVVAPGRPAALAEGWRRVAALSRDGRRNLGDRARERVRERYDLSRAAAAFESLYAEAASVGR